MSIPTLGEKVKPYASASFPRFTDAEIRHAANVCALASDADVRTKFLAGPPSEIRTLCETMTVRQVVRARCLLLYAVRAQRGDFARIMDENQIMLAETAERVVP